MRPFLFLHLVFEIVEVTSVTYNPQPILPDLAAQKQIYDCGCFLFSLNPSIIKEGQEDPQIAKAGSRRDIQEFIDLLEKGY